MYDKLLEKVKRIKPNALSDSDILGFFEEAVVLVCDGDNDYAGGEYLDHVLLYYALAHVALYSGDLAEYSNYFTLYNNAATEYRRRTFSASKTVKDTRGKKTGVYTHLW